MEPGRTADFTYDALHRLKTAATSGSPASPRWGLEWTYDLYGNRTAQSVTAGSGVPSNSVNIDPLTNRITGAPYSYDAAGNLLNDGLNALIYDGESRVVTNTQAGVTTNYTYDGNGKRVQKSTGKLYWYGAGSEPLAESDAAGNITDEYIFFGGKRIARRDSTGNVFYYFADHLGTSRVLTQANGTACSEADYYPFGGERVVSDTCPQTYKFTGKERDNESGLDFFGARYYASTMGRFMSADSPSYSSLKFPQSWNPYAYTLNNPLKFVDPDGHAVECSGAPQGACIAAIAEAIANQEAAARVYANTVRERAGWFRRTFLRQQTVTRTFVGIKGDLESFRKLSPNANKLADLVTDKRVFGLSISSTYSPTYTGLLDKIISGGAEFPLNGGSTSRTSSQGTLPEVWIDPNPATHDVDTDAARDGIPPANLGEKTAHELLGHVWAAEIAGLKPGTAQHKRATIQAENEVRRTDPTRGQKTRHHD